jgi:hypothetical protein
MIGQRQDDRRLPLLGEAKLLFGAKRSALARRFASRQGCSWPRLALDLLGHREQDRRTPATFDWRTIGSTGLNT